jgi:AraC-like DNA-binding protein
VTVESGGSLPGGREIVLRAACPVLRAYVRGYCGYAESAASSVRRVQPSSSTVGLIIGFGPPVGITYPRHSGSSPARFTSFVAGLHATYAVVESSGRQYGVQIDLTPIGAHLLLDVPMVSLANRVVELDQVLGPFAAQLAGQLFDAQTWAARFDVLDAALVRRLPSGREPSPVTDRAWRRLTDTSGQLSIGMLTAELGVSRQYLAARFRDEVGLPPKTVARILRFQRAIDLLGPDDAQLTQVARDCGYFDQAHFNRDFQELAGSTPTDFRARRLADGAGVLAAEGRSPGG